MCVPTAFADPVPYLQGLYHVLPCERLDFVLQRTGRRSLRRLPAPSIAGQVIALALFPDLLTPTGLAPPP